MCTCNGEAYLKEQLESILSQTVPPDELIVSDDASTDGTLEIVNSFQARSPFSVKVMSNGTRLGVCKNFENAICHCSGDIIFFSDQDDVWLPSKIMTIVAVFAKHPGCGYVFSNAELMDEQGRRIERDLWTSIGFDREHQASYGGPGQLATMLRWYTPAYGMTMAVRECFKPKLLPFECRFSRAILHDGWVPLYLTCMGAYGVAIPDRLVKYRQHCNQLASAGRPLGFLDLAMNMRSSANQANLDFAEFLEQLALRLPRQASGDDSVQRAKEELLGKAAHVRARVRANTIHGFERFKTVLAEAVSGRYGRYSRSFKSIIKDLTTS